MDKKMNAAKGGMRRALRHLGTIAINEARGNFERESFRDRTIEKWPKRKGNVDPNRKILHKTGRLKRSMSMSIGGNSVTITNSAPYSGIHNRKVGVVRTYNGKSYPGRQFLGSSAVLAKKSAEYIARMLNKAMLS